MKWKLAVETTVLSLELLALLTIGRDFVWWLVWGDSCHPGRKVTFIRIDIQQKQHAVNGRASTKDGNKIYVKYGEGAIAAVKASDRGVTWCYGWKGPQVDALRSACVMA